MRRKSESRSPQQEKSKALASSAKERQLPPFSRPQLLTGEDAASYDQILSAIRAMIKPVDVIEELLISDIVAQQWDLLRWRRLKFSTLRNHQEAALDDFLTRNLPYELFAQEYADGLAAALEDNDPEMSADTARQLADACAEDDRETIDKVYEKLSARTASIYSPNPMDTAWEKARSRKATELAREYVHGKQKAVSIVNEILKDENLDIEGLMAEELPLELIDQLERLTTISETRRNATLREIERHRAGFGASLRHSIEIIEDAEVIDTIPAKNAA